MSRDKARTSLTLLLYCGIASSLLYVAMNVFVAMQWPDYSSRTMTVSELAAVGAPTRALWIPLAAIYSVLVIAFGWGVHMAARAAKRARVAAKLLMLYGCTGLLWPLFPMHQRHVLAAGGASWSDLMHIVLTIVTVVIMLLAMGFAAVSFGRSFRYFTQLSMGALMLFGLLTSMEAPNVDVDGPTPWIGIWERINIGVFLLWIVVLAARFLPGPVTASSSGTAPR